MLSLMLISIKPLSAQWDTGGNTFTPGSCIKVRFGTLNDACDIQFISNSIERMRLTSTGNFGIGTTAPIRMFHVNGDIRFENLPMDTRTTAIMIDANGDLSTRALQIADWNTAFSWGNHAGLYRPISWVPDWIDITNKPIFATVATSGSYNDLSNTPNLNIANWNTAFSWGNHDTVGYLLEETDPQWISDSANYYTKSNLQLAGQSQVHYENLINVPSDLSDFTDEDTLLFDGDWSSLGGDAPNISLFINDAGYIINPDDADADPTNELQTLSANDTTLTLSDGGDVLLQDLNYWQMNDDTDVFYDRGFVGIGLENPQHSLHIHSDTRTYSVDNAEEVNSVIKSSRITRPISTAITALQITNAESGTTQNDGLQFRLSNNNAVIYNREAGDLILLTNINGNRLQLAENGSLNIGTHTQSHLFVSESGNVGVGTDEPEKRLDINGNVRIKGVGPLLQLENNNTGHKWELYSGGSVGNNGLGIFDRTEEQYLIAFAANGNVGIGTVNPSSKLTVKGMITCQELLILDNVPSSDYVFKVDYNLLTVPDLEKYIQQHGHLPDVPSAEEFKKNGYKAGDMDDLLLRKIEELSLYIIEQEKRIEKLEKKIESNTKEKE